MNSLKLYIAAYVGIIIANIWIVSDTPNIIKTPAVIGFMICGLTAFYYSKKEK